MTESIMKHRKCGGNLVLDLAGMFTFKTPSLSITSEGIVVGVTELQYNPKGEPFFVCGKCQTQLSLKDSTDILVECVFCEHTHPATKIFCSSGQGLQLPDICEDCLKMLRGEKEPTEEIKKVTQFLKLPKDGLVFKSYSDVFKIKINI